MDLEGVLAPQSANQIIAVLLVWLGVTIILAQLLDMTLVRWEIILGSIVLFIWTVWAINYRLEQHRQEQFNR